MYNYLGKGGRELENNKKSKISKFSICMYILALLMLGYFVFMIFGTIEYIKDMVNQGQIVMETDLKAVVHYYMETCLKYLVYAIVFAGFGFVANILISFTNRFADLDEDFDDDDMDADFDEYAGSDEEGTFIDMDKNTEPEEAEYRMELAEAEEVGEAEEIVADDEADVEEASSDSESEEEK